jgi:hypothetical protein
MGRNKSATFPCDTLTKISEPNNAEEVTLHCLCETDWYYRGVKVM